MQKRCSINSVASTTAHNVYVAAQSAAGVESPGSQGREWWVDEVSRLALGGVPEPGTESQSSHTAASQPGPRRVTGLPQGGHLGQTPCVSVAKAAGDGFSRCLTPKLCPEKAHTRPQVAEPSPIYQRDALLSYYRIRDVAEELRAEATAAGADLRTRLGWASLIDDIDGWIASCQSRLAALVRSGGRGVPPSGVRS